MSLSAELQAVIFAQTDRARVASRVLGRLSAQVKNEALVAMAEALREHRMDILSANADDVVEARQLGQTEARIDRLQLSDRRIEEMGGGLRQVADLADPVGEVLEETIRADGLRIQKIRVPLGVIGMVYESRPNVTVDAAALALKTGNAMILRGGKEALRSNMALMRALHEGMRAVGLPEHAVQLIERPERETVDVLIQARGRVDLVIPRGGPGLINHVVEHAVVPVIETGVGNCHVYVDVKADLQKAVAIVINAKTQRPSVCNAMETLLVHEAVAEAFLPDVAAELLQRGVQLRGCERSLQILQSHRFVPEQSRIISAEASDWETEFSDLILAVRVVPDVVAAIEHIERYGTRHSETIVTQDQGAADQFLAQVDAAAVYHNASTRFTDGFEFGFGAEIGISTQKLHARGPMGLRELTSYKYVVRGDGHVRS